MAVLVGVVIWAIYSLVTWAWWQRWDTAAREAFLQAAVDSSKARRVPPPTAPTPSTPPPVTPAASVATSTP